MRTFTLLPGKTPNFYSTQRPPYGVGREGEGAGDVRSGRQRREERLGLVNESWDFYRFKAPTATFTALNKV